MGPPSMGDVGPPPPLSWEMWVPSPPPPPQHERCGSPLPPHRHGRDMGPQSRVRPASCAGKPRPIRPTPWASGRGKSPRDAHTARARSKTVLRLRCVPSWLPPAPRTLGQASPFACECGRELGPHQYHSRRGACRTSLIRSKLEPVISNHIHTRALLDRVGKSRVTVVMQINSQ